MPPSSRGIHRSFIMIVVAVSHTAQQGSKILPCCANQLLMVTRLKIDIGKTGQCLVKERLDTVSKAERWNCPGLAIAEQFCKFVLGGEVKVPFEFLSQVLYLNPVTGGNHDHGIPGRILNNDCLGDMIFTHMSSFSCFVTGFSVWG